MRHFIRLSISLCVVSVVFCGASWVHAQTADSRSNVQDTTTTSSDTFLQSVLSNLKESHDPNSNGVFDCSSAQQSMPVGTLTAIGGTYVPVYDAAVTQNTGYLLYKQCVLDKLVSQERQAAVADAVRGTVNSINNEGLIQTDPAADRATIAAQVRTEYGKNYKKSGLLGTFRDSVANLALSQYDQSIAAPSYTCTDDANSTLQKYFSGQLPANQIFRATMMLARNPSCIPIVAANEYLSSLQSEVAVRQSDFQEQVVNGIKPRQNVQEIDVGNGEKAIHYVTVEPAYEISQSLHDALGAGFDMQKNADSIGELINATFANLQTVALNSDQGVAGLSQPQSGGSGSFLDQLFGVIAQNFQGAVVNSALTILQQALSAEQEYFKYRSQTLDFLNSTQQYVVVTQNQCWIDLEHGVRAVAGGTPLTVATSTAFGDALLNAAVAPLQVPIANDVQTSSQTIAALKQMIASLQNANSQTLQQIALAQVDALSQAHALHSSQDAQQAQQDLASIEQGTHTSVDATIAVWASTTPATTTLAHAVPAAATTTTIGWCATTTPSVIQTWFNIWR